MSEPLDELYLTWLYARNSSVRVTNPSRTYWSLTRHLFKKEFVWFVPNDDNRVEDGRDIRYEFLNDSGIQNPDPAWMGLGCSMLEMLIGLSLRLSFETDSQPRVWYWRMLDNLDLSQFTDHNYNESAVDAIVDTVIWRTYDRKGNGGLFPLTSTRQDQRNVEIWYQLSAYLLERV